MPSPAITCCWRPGTIAWPTRPAEVKKRVIAWGWALPLGVLNGLLLWLLSDDQRFNIQLTNPLNGQVYTLIPALLLLAAPVSAVLIALFLTLAGDGAGAARVAVGLGLAAGAAYVLLLFPRIWPRLFQEQYLSLMVLHLGLLAWAAVGVVALARRGDQGEPLRLPGQVAGGVRGGRAAGDRRRDCSPPSPSACSRPWASSRLKWCMRLFFAGGGGLIAIVAVALVYDPRCADAAVIRRGAEQAGGAVDAPAAAADSGGAAGLRGLHPLQLARAVREPRSADDLQRYALRGGGPAGGRDAGA